MARTLKVPRCVGPDMENVYIRTITECDNGPVTTLSPYDEHPIVHGTCPLVDTSLAAHTNVFYPRPGQMMVMDTVQICVMLGGKKYVWKEWKDLR